MVHFLTLTMNRQHRQKLPSLHGTIQNNSSGIWQIWINHPPICPTILTTCCTTRISFQQKEDVLWLDLYNIYVQNSWLSAVSKSKFSLLCLPDTKSTQTVTIYVMNSWLLHGEQGFLSKKLCNHTRYTHHSQCTPTASKHTPQHIAQNRTEVAYPRKSCQQTAGADCFSPHLCDQERQAGCERGPDISTSP